jgi:mannose-6-phosphate isomerase-like protein (cupin superfamily)
VPELEPPRRKDAAEATTRGTRRTLTRRTSLFRNLRNRHEHAWDSVIYVDQGWFEFTVGEEQRRLGPREGVTIPAGVRHGLTTDAGSRLIEAWYPVKQDG